MACSKSAAGRLGGNPTHAVTERAGSQINKPAF
jgi:hypothetical protein